MTDTNKLTALTKDFIAFQQEIPEIPFNAKVSYGTTQFKYTDLPLLLKTLRPLLNKHNFALIQSVDSRLDVNGTPSGVIKTILLHQTGEALTSDTFYDISGKSQDQGARITYAKRYALCAICGVQGEEDLDGTNVTNPEPAKPTKKPEPNKDERDALKNALAAAKTGLEINTLVKDFKAKYELTAAFDKALTSVVNKELERVK